MTPCGRPIRRAKAAVYEETVTRGMFTPRPLLRLKHVFRAAPSYALPRQSSILLHLDTAARLPMTDISLKKLQALIARGGRASAGGPKYARVSEAFAEDPGACSCRLCVCSR